MLPLPAVVLLVGLALVTYGGITNNSALVFAGLALVVISIEMNAIQTALNRLAETVTKVTTPVKIKMK